MTELITLAKQYEIELTPPMAEQFATYQRLLLCWNERMNLTAITQPREVLEKHFLDSLIPLAAWGLLPGARVIDVGTGAGFPGIPMKIARPDIELTLLDSQLKRTEFLRELSRELGQENRIIHGRAEEAAHDPALRESFCAATARAVAALPVLCELCLGFLRPGGVFFAMKGPDSVKEAESAREAAAILGGGEIKSCAYALPSFGERIIYLVEKASQTPAKYPRKHKQMTKAPL